MSYKYGYCALTADYLHIGHINFLYNCKQKCEKLLVGIMTDDCVKEYTGKSPIMNVFQRERMISSLRIVNKTMLQPTYEFHPHILRLKEFYKGDFVIFDSEEHKRKNADILIPRTPNFSSSLFKELNENPNYSQCSL